MLESIDAQTTVRAWLFSGIKTFTFIIETLTSSLQRWSRRVHAI